MMKFRYSWVVFVIAAMLLFMGPPFYLNPPWSVNGIYLLQNQDGIIIIEDSNLEMLFLGDEPRILVQKIKKLDLHNWLLGDGVLKCKHGCLFDEHGASPMAVKTANPLTSWITIYYKLTAPKSIGIK